MPDLGQGDDDYSVALILRYKCCNLCADRAIGAVVLIGRQRVINQAQFILGKQSGQRYLSNCCVKSRGGV